MVQRTFVERRRALPYGLLQGYAAGFLLLPAHFISFIKMNGDLLALVYLSKQITFIPHTATLHNCARVGFSMAPATMIRKWTNIMFYANSCSFIWLSKKGQYYSSKSEVKKYLTTKSKYFIQKTGMKKSLQTLTFWACYKWVVTRI